MNFRDVTTVNFQGLVVAFARGDTPVGDPGEGLLVTDIYYNVLALEVDSQSDAMDWTGFRALTLPDAVRPAGMNMINVPVTYDARHRLAGLTDADARFRVISNQEYLYVFRQTVQGSLLVNRLRLVREGGSTTAQEVVYALQPAWDVRFQRSAKPDVPADARDSQGYLATDRAPFIEPAFELPLADAVAEGRFDVQFLARGEGPLLTCAVFVAVEPADRIDVYQLPLDAAGLFVLPESRLVSGRVAADFSFQLVDAQARVLDLRDRPSAAFYLKQERVLDAARGSYTVKRSGRMLIAQRAMLPDAPDAPATLATVDLAVAADGTLAQPLPSLRVDPVGVANYTLQFDTAAYVQMPKWSPTQQYSIDLWIYPTAIEPLSQQILGPLDDDTAPYLRLVDGTALQVGFQGKNGQPLSARTAPGSVRQRAWTRVQVSFDTEHKYRIRLNGAAVPCTTQGDGDHPLHGSIQAISAPTQGFIGCIDHVIAYDGADWDPATRVGEFTFDTIDYIGADQLPLDPPQTPNAFDENAPGKVFGARLIPSTRPEAVSAGALSWDARGLSIYAAYFDGLDRYGALASSPFLLAGADGRVHCYFRGASDAFSVMQLDTENARATFEADWATRQGVVERGALQLVSMQSGAFMNEAVVTIAPSEAGGAGDLFCNLSLQSPSKLQESWEGVPRSLRLLPAVLAGGTVADPADPRLRTGERIYFDTSGTRSAAYLRLENSPGEGALALVSRGSRAPLASVQLTATDLTLTFAPPRWTGTPMSVRWPAVPLRADAFVEVLSGQSTAFPYADGGSIDAACYSLSARSAVVGASRVVVMVKPGADALQWLEVAPVADDPLLCDVGMTLGALQAQWRNVPRQQTRFNEVLEGGDQAGYDYAKHASGDYKAIGALLVITTDGGEAAVDDVLLGGEPPGAQRAGAKQGGGARRKGQQRGNAAPVPETDLRIAAALIAAFSTAPNDTAACVALTAKPVQATCFQRAVRSDAATAAAAPAAPAVITTGSALFSAVPRSLPVSGAAALLQDTPLVDDKHMPAPLTLQGFGGGWRNRPPQRTLAYQWDNWVRFQTDEAKAPNIGALTLAGDMSLELWCRPERASQQMLQPYQRLLSFSRAPAGSTDKVQYLAGLHDCPSLIMAADSRIRGAFNTERGSACLWFQPQAAGGGIIGAIATIGVVNPLLQLSLGDDRLVRLAFVPDPAQPDIVATHAIDIAAWHQATLTFDSTVTVTSGQYHYRFNVRLYLGGALQGTQVYTATRGPTDAIDLATLVLGDAVGKAGLPMLLNEVAFFGDVLDIDAIERFAEQRVPDNAADLAFKWMLIEGDGKLAINSAVTGTRFDVPVEPSATWQSDGLYSRAVLGYRDNVAVLDADPFIHGWTHLAMVHQAGHAVALGGRDFGSAGNDDSLTLADAFSLEGWVALDGAVGAIPQTVLGKGADYALTIDTAGRPTFSAQVATRDDKDVEQTLLLSVTAKNALAIGRPTYLATHFETVVVTAADGGQGSKPVYEVRMRLYVDGQLAASVVGEYAHPVQRVLSNAPLDLGRSPLAGGSAYLRGRLADVRVWSRCLSETEIARVQADRRVPRNADGLVSWWRFDEANGRVSFDAKGDNDVTWTRGNLRQLFPATAIDAFYVNGQPAGARFLDSANAIGGYGSADAFAFARSDGPLAAGFHGQLADVRIWNGMLTGEQIADGMHRPPSGSEPNLRGYWDFGNGSGGVVEDRTGRGNDGVLAASGSVLPQWRTSTAPLGDEAAEVLDILGGVPTFAQRDIDQTPAVVEYADLQRDAYGNQISVMKRAYLSVYAQQLSMLTGYKVGDLDTVYLGQAQSRPTLVGYIEGAPPLPAENQTMPYWRNGFSEINQYAGLSSVTFTEADNTVYAYNATRDVADTHAFSIKGGLYGGGQYSTSAGIGFEVETPVVAFEGHLGVQSGFELTDHHSHGIGTQSGTSRSFATGMKPGGRWEPGSTPEQWVNPVVGRRFVPDNTGVALVKSMTVDVYASILRSSGSMVKLSMVPNPDIPVDVNLIDFPIDPTYIKNGTLDGKVGLRNDPSYPDADLQRGSYFKPLEAYAIKRRIERETARLESYYQQYDTASYAGKLKDASSFETYRNTVRDNTAYDWSEHLSKRSIINTYVWTAGGGTYAEQMQPMNVYAEQHGAISSTTLSAGAVGDIQMAFPVAGFYLDFDYLYSSATEVNAVKSTERGASFDLSAEATPDAYLYAPILDDAALDDGASDAALDGHGAGGGRVIYKGTDVGFGASPTEGKVDGYRYQAFMLAPDAANATAFFDKVVDPAWLRNSKDASAAALREAVSAPSGPWRVLYRVSYVSRIPPKFQPVPAQTQSPDLQPPANLAYNALLVRLVRDQIKVVAPGALEIGAAVAAVLGTAAAPGTLAASLPWWPQFLQDGANPTLSAGAILRTLREDLLQYMIAAYAAAGASA